MRNPRNTIPFVKTQLRAEWRKLARLHGDPHGTVWHHPDVQLLARAKLLKARSRIAPKALSPACSALAWLSNLSFLPTPFCQVLKPALPSLVTICDGSSRPGATASGGAYASWSTFAAQMLRIGGVIEARALSFTRTCDVTSYRVGAHAG